MFDFGFWELFLCMAIALVVLGPEKLPGVARTLGRWAGRARIYVRSLSSEFERQARVAELQREVTAAGEAVRDEARAVGESLKPDVPPKDAGGG